MHDDKLENSTCDLLKYTMGSPIPIVSICMGKSIKILSDFECKVNFWYAACPLVQFGISHLFLESISKTEKLICEL